MNPQPSSRHRKVANIQPRQYFIKANGLQFCVEERGNPQGPPLILIMGLACQLIHWPETLLEGLAARGYRVIRFDNRDIGLSDKVTSRIQVNTRMSWLYHRLGLKPQANYSLRDMAADTAGILQAMQVQSAHVVGVSMGGMIAQLLAAHYPEQVRSLTVMMSSTNHPRLPIPELSLMLKLNQVGPAAHDQQTVTKRWLTFWKAVQSPDYPTPTARVRELVEASYQRCYSPGGTLRQMQAILATGSLETVIRHIRCPTLVIHGDRDPLLRPACGKAVAKRIRDAEFHLIRGMGHDLPEALLPRFINMIGQTVAEGEARLSMQPA